jgi:hypothetical protein
MRHLIALRRNASPLISTQRNVSDFLFAAQRRVPRRHSARLASPQRNAWQRLSARLPATQRNVSNFLFATRLRASLRCSPLLVSTQRNVF